MPRDRLRVVVLALAYLVLIVVSAVVMGWFVIEMPGLGRLEIGLRHAAACEEGRQCIEFVMPRKGSGMYGTCAAIAFWGSFVLALPVLYQAYLRASAGYAPPDISRKAYGGSLLLIMAGFFAGYLFAPDLGGAAQFGMMMEVKRTWAPLLFFAAHICGVAAMHLASSETVDDGSAFVSVHPVARASIAQPAIAPVQEPAPPVSVKQPAITLEPEAHEVTTAKKLNYVVQSGEMSGGGIDARRGDGKQLLVLWRDVVGFVVRRTPDDLGGLTFADIVSVKGSTLRLVSTTRLTGISVAGLGDDRVRSLATYVQSVCPDLAIDGATKKFLAGEPAAQLRDAAMLAVHDERLS